MVAPYVGAWIETREAQWNQTNALSHPTWVRGLKLNDKDKLAGNIRSHPTWVRGLKR